MNKIKKQNLTIASVAMEFNFYYNNKNQLKRKLKKKHTKIKKNITFKLF